jgi:hypothetical protein
MSFVVQIPFLKLDRPRGTFRMWCLFFLKNAFLLSQSFLWAANLTSRYTVWKVVPIAILVFLKGTLDISLFSIFPPWIKENNIESKGHISEGNVMVNIPEVPVTPFVLFIWKLFYSLNLQRKDTGQTVCGNSQNFLVEDPLKRRTRLKMQLI